jgi:hypothetical protein
MTASSALFDCSWPTRCSATPGWRSRSAGPLGLRLLHPVLPEHALPGLDQRRDRLGRMGLAHRDERDLASLAPGECAGMGDPLLDMTQQGGCALHAPRYSGASACARPPRLWLLSDERNDAVLERPCAACPRGSGFVYRHYHFAA